MDTLLDPDEANENYALYSSSSSKEVSRPRPHSDSSRPRSCSAASIEDGLASTRSLRANSNNLQSPPPIRESDLEEGQDARHESAKGDAVAQSRPSPAESGGRTDAAPSRRTHPAVPVRKLSYRSSQLLHVGGHLNMSTPDVPVDREADLTLDDDGTLDLEPALKREATGSAREENSTESIPIRPKGKAAVVGATGQRNSLFPDMERSDHRQAVESIVGAAEQLALADSTRVAGTVLAGAPRMPGPEGHAGPGNVAVGSKQKKLSTLHSVASDESDARPQPHETPQKRAEGGRRGGRRH